MLSVQVIPYHYEVTGSRFMIIITFSDGSKSIGLVDDGYCQERKYEKMNYENDMDSNKINWIVITHNHADHMGLVPKTVESGYGGNIYMTEQTKMVIKPFWMDIASHQIEQAEELRQRYPKEARKFNPLYNNEAVDKAYSQSVAVKYRMKVRLHSNIEMKLFENNHLFGAAIVWLRITDRETVPINLVFTGDYKPESRLFEEISLPKELLKTEKVIIITECLYGTTNSVDIPRVFQKYVLEDLSKRRTMIFGLFAQGRYQEVLYEQRKLQDMNAIPEGYRIFADGALGLETTDTYDRYLRRKEKIKILPKGLEKVSINNRAEVLNYQGPMIVDATSGMMSFGPVIMYIQKFIDNPNAVIYVMGYPAEGTLSRKLVEAKYGDTIEIDKCTYIVRATIRVIREFSSHAPRDVLLSLINSFEDPYFVGLNHATQEVKEAFEKSVWEECPKVKRTAIINRGFSYNFYANAYGITHKIVKLDESYYQYTPKSASEARKEQKSNRKKIRKIQKNIGRREKKEAEKRAQMTTAQKIREHIDKKNEEANRKFKEQPKKGILDSKCITTFSKENKNHEKVKNKKCNYIK